MNGDLAKPNSTDQPDTPPSVRAGQDGKLDLLSCFRFQKKALAATFATKNMVSIVTLLDQCIATLGKPNANEHDYNWVLAAVHGIGPQNELEGMLAAQMVSTHNLAMRFIELAAHHVTERPAASSYAELATKMLRTFAAQVEALNRMRGKGPQKMVIEHVTVNQGGQAVVGSINHNGTRGIPGQG